MFLETSYLYFSDNLLDENISKHIIDKFEYKMNNYEDLIGVNMYNITKYYYTYKVHPKCELKSFLRIFLYSYKNV